MTPLCEFTLLIATLLPYLIVALPEGEVQLVRRVPEPACPKSVARDGCITEAMATGITDRWAEIFNLDYGHKNLQELINCTTAPDIYIYDKTFTFGKGGNGLIYGSRVELFHQERAAYNARNTDAIQKGSYSTVFKLHNCDTISWRWMFNGTTSGIPNPPDATNTKKGNPVVYYGTDLIFLEKDSKLIKHVVTSGDWYNMYYAIGMSFDGTSLCPGTQKSND